MARVGLDYETVKQTAVKLLSQGSVPSVQKIREVLGTGSNTTIAEHLKLWRDEYAKKTIHYLPASMPKELISTFDVLWQTAMEHASNQLTEYKKAVEDKYEAALENERESQESVANIKLKIEALSIALEQETVTKQKINVELAVVNDRLLKQDEALSTQKNQYEDRLKRIYEEKDNLFIECRRLQNEIKSLHEKVALQAEEHRRLLIQQNSLQEHSETRWLRLIDQARQETKEERKKYENIRNYSEEQLKKNEYKLTDAQKNFDEKDTQLKNALEKIALYKKEISELNDENSITKSGIVALKRERKLKVIKKGKSKA